MFVRLTIRHEHLVRAGWDECALPALEPFVPLDAMDAVQTFLGDCPPATYQPSLRFPKMLQFMRAWGCTHTAWLHMSVPLDSAVVIVQNLPVDQKWLLPHVQAVLDSKPSTILKLAEVVALVRAKLVHERYSSVADCLHPLEIELAMARLSGLA